MTDEEIRKLAKEIFEDAIRNTDFPDLVDVSKDSDGNTLFLQFLEGKAGIGLFLFRPDISLIENFLENPQSLKNTIGSELSEKVVISWAQVITRGLFSNFHLDIEEVFQNFLDAPIAMVHQVFVHADTITSTPSFENQENSTHLFIDAKVEFDKLVNKRSTNLRKRLKNQINLAKKFQVPNKNLIGYFYQVLILNWKEAKKCYKRNKNYPNWQNMVSVAFPDLPYDLIGRLANPDSYLSMPSSIALENSARMCGFNNDSLELRTLQNYLKESRQWLDEKSDIEVKTEEKTFFECVREDIENQILINKSFNQLMEIEKLPLIHQIVYSIIKEQIDTDNKSNEND